MLFFMRGNIVWAAASFGKNKSMVIQKAKVEFFEEKILDFFRKAGREHLPWRRKNITAYEVWVSEIMLQQTQVNRVIEYYNRFLARFPDVQALARTSWEEFLPYYQGLGYYARGRNMLQGAQIIVKEHGGKFPRDKKLLQKIPGIGPYTASAIMSFAYGEDHLAWDTNLRRVIGRYFSGSKHLAGTPATWEKKFAASRKILNAAFMDFGSAVCPARPKCGICPLRPQCVYFKEKGRKESRVKKVRAVFPQAQAQALVFLHAGHRVYYGAKKSYTPFFVPHTHNTRAGIKKYFSRKYALTLSVRPPYQKTYFRGKPTLLVNAQILLGKPAFREFSKDSVAGYKKNHKL